MKTISSLRTGTSNKNSVSSFRPPTNVTAKMTPLIMPYRPYMSPYIFTFLSVFSLTCLTNGKLTFASLIRPCLVFYQNMNLISLSSLSTPFYTSYFVNFYFKLIGLTRTHTTRKGIVCLYYVSN